MGKFNFDKDFNQFNDGKCIIQQCISKFDESENEKENTVRHVFADRSNNKLEVVLTKVVVLNQFYSTQLNSNKPKEIKPGQTYHMDVVSMAHHIVAWKQFSEYCNSPEKEKRLEAVAYISGDSEKKSDYRIPEQHKKAYSFATKYCSWHNPNHYPIVDSFSKGMLYYLNKEFGFFCGKFKQEDLNTYSVFCDVYEALQEYLKKHNKYYSFRDIDKFLWYYGKTNNIAI